LLVAVLFLFAFVRRVASDYYMNISRLHENSLFSTTTFVPTEVLNSC